MAYDRKLLCRKCGKKAAVEVFDRWNGSMGLYCTPHGRERLKLQQERESK